MHKTNSVMMQYFHWHSPADGTLWNQLSENASELSKSGITDDGIMLFDAGLHYNIEEASRKGKEYDLKIIFNNTLVKEVPELAVTLVSNHDTQPLQALESVVEDWFKLLAYALILLRRDGYPYIFAADYYGAKYKDVGKDGKEYEINMPSHRWIIDKFLETQKKYAYGDQYDYFDHPNCVSWTRHGDKNHKGGIAVILSNGEYCQKYMQTASPNITYIDITEHYKNTVVTNSEGWAEFRCPAGSVSVWVQK